MNSFEFQNPTKIIFGEGAVEKLAGELAPFGKRVLLVYGKGAIKRAGIYDAAVAQLKAAGKEVFELSGVMPNPTAEKVREGLALCKEHGIDFILTVGGGSVIDCGKAIAAGAMLEEDFWKPLFERRIMAKEALPLGTVLTMSGTASEMNGTAVITNEEAKKKASFSSPATYPRFSILDPTYTYSLPTYQLVSGVCDVLSHLMEQYFSGEDDNISDDLNEALQRSIVKNARIALKNPEDYTARSNIMWGATLALNRVMGCGKSQDWQMHQIEHQIAVFYDVAHGMGLAAITASYLRYILKDGLAKLRQYAVNVWGVSEEEMSDKEIALEGIARLEDFFEEMGAPISLRELGVEEKTHFDEIAASTNLLGGYRKFTKEDVLAVLEASF